MNRIDVAATFTASGVTALFTGALARASKLLDGIRALKDAPKESLTWENTFGAFDSMVSELFDAVEIPQLMSVAHPDSAVREAAMQADPKADAFQSALYTDDAIASVLNRFAQLATGLSAEQQRCIDEVLREYRRNGLSLAAADRDHLRELNEKITALSQAFEKHLAETSSFIEIEPAQLDGLSAAFIANHPVGENSLVRITTDYPDLVPFMRFAKDRNAARDLYALSDNRASDKNLPILKELRSLRAEKASLLGYENWAAYILEARMAKNTETVRSFLSNLHEKLVPLRKRETAELVEMQRKLLPGSGDQILVSNVKYLEEALRQEKFSLDSQKVAEYFEVNAVMNGIMGIASVLYAVRFDRLTIPGWHEDVMVFDVSDKRGVIGRTYLDLYPREGKYKHAAVFGMIETRVEADGSRRMPVGALVCNFPKPGEAPALMGHDDVVTFFHEFGHLLHHVLSESKLAMFAVPMSLATLWRRRRRCSRPGLGIALRSTRLLVTTKRGRRSQRRCSML
jgi:thimet oligopeptidase